MVQPDGASPSSQPNTDHNASDETQRSIAGNNAEIKPAQDQTPEITNQPAQIVKTVRPAQKDEPTMAESEPKKFALANQSQTAALASSPPVTPSVQSTPSVESTSSGQSTPAVNQLRRCNQPQASRWDLID